jgi:hypothetical protein
LRDALARGEAAFFVLALDGLRTAAGADLRFIAAELVDED